MPRPQLFHLGAPIGTAIYCADFVAAKMTNISHLLDQIAMLDHVQAALLLLRFTASFGKIAYYARTIPTEAIRNQCIEFDAMVIDDPWRDNWTIPR